MPRQKDFTEHYDERAKAGEDLGFAGLGLCVSRFRGLGPCLVGFPGASGFCFRGLGG